jgi:competence protein ComEA
MSKGMIQAMVAVAAMALAGEAMAEKKAFDRTPREVTGVININTASVKELELLPGVGNHTAKLIVAYREKTPFKSAQELTNVKGVGQGIYRHVKDFLTVSGATTLAAKPRAKSADAPMPKPAMAKN